MYGDEKPKRDQDEFRVALARDKSYTTSAFVTLVAYWLMWLPGLILNIVYLREARENERVAGHSLPGVGCLKWLFIWNVVWVLFLCALLGGLGTIGFTTTG
ncbi:MAG: hypothetical protein OXB89_10075 [Anaerolineaceae bacterium]|nr:hypothetical protein [Anaerolineaceae bacterium]